MAATIYLMYVLNGIYAFHPSDPDQGSALHMLKK